METLQTIRSRIGTIESLVKSTSAMKMVATVKLTKMSRKDSLAIEAAGFLKDMLYKAIIEASHRDALPENFWALNNSKGPKLLIVLSTDQGFCGAFNNTIIEEARRHAEEFDKLIVIGKKGHTLGGSNEINLENRYDIKSSAGIIRDTIRTHLSKESYSKVSIVSGKFKSIISQKAMITDVFDTNAIDLQSTEYSKIETNIERFINDLFSNYLSKLLNGIIGEHLVCELSARTMAMDNSVKNAQDMKESLATLYNRIRQAKITQELTEIISSMENV